MVNLTTGAPGPTDGNCKSDDDNFHFHNFDWKGRRGSLGVYETKDLTDWKNVHPLRLLYPKRTKNPSRNSVCNCDRKTKCKHHFKRAKYIYEDENKDWLKLKHRILLYPSSSEKSFLKRKMANPVPKALGPRDIDEYKLPFEYKKYDWKEMVESLGEYETADLDKNNIYPLRLMYPKKTQKPSEVILPNLEDFNSYDGKSYEEKSEWAMKRNLNCQKSEDCTKSESEELSDHNNTDMVKPEYKWKGMHGSLGDYEVPDSSSKRNTYPIRLMYSKSKKSVGNLRSLVKTKTRRAVIPKLEERCYNWKGKRGSIGDYETQTSSSGMSSIFPIRMYYPKTRISCSFPRISTVGSRQRTKGRTPCSINDIFPPRTLYPKTKPTSLTSNRHKAKTRKDRAVLRNNDEKSDVNVQQCDERCYDWKGRRGSFGLYETKNLSSMGGIFPLRLCYPKVQPLQEVSDWPPKKSKSIEKEQSKNSRKKMHRHTNFLDKDGEFSTSGMSSFSSQWMDERRKNSESGTQDFLIKLEMSEREKSHNERGKRDCVDEFVNIDSLPVNENGKVKDIGETGNKPQLGVVSSCDSSQRTTVTGWSEDDLTSMERGSFSSNGSGFGFIGKISSFSENHQGNLCDAKEVDTALPLGFSKKTKQQRVCMWSSEDETSSLSRIPKVKSQKNKQHKSERRRAFSDGWKPAKYDIPDEITEIKNNGIYAPIGLYSTRRTKTCSKRKRKRKKIGRQAPNSKCVSCI